MPQVKKSEYRQRVFQMPDGTIELVFGNDVAPEGGKLIVDHDVVTITTVVDHVDTPAPEPIPIPES